MGRVDELESWALFCLAASPDAACLVSGNGVAVGASPAAFFALAAAPAAAAAPAPTAADMAVEALVVPDFLTVFFSFGSGGLLWILGIVCSS
jgi:hypothetical protein